MKRKILLIFLASIFSLSSILIAFPVTVADASPTHHAYSSQHILWDWPTFQYDTKRTGFSQSTAPDSNHTLWNWSQNYTFFDSPAVVNNRVYITGGSTLYVLNESTGALIWNFTIGDRTAGPPTVKSDIVYFVGGDDQLHALNATTGETLWDTTGRKFGAPGVIPTVADGTVIVGEQWPPGNVLALNASSGDILWTYETGSSSGVFPCIAADESTVFAVAWASWGVIPTTLYALDLQDGSLIWNYSMGLSPGWSNRPAFPTVAYGFVFVISWDGNLHALNKTNGNLEWKRNIGEYQQGAMVHSSPAVAYGMVFVGSHDHKVYALNATNGTLIWNYTTSKKVYSSPAVADGKVFVGAQTSEVSGGTLLALNATNGILIWSYSPGAGSILASPAIARGMVFMGLSTTLYAFPDFDVRPHYEITVDPIFYDNRGEQLVPPPSYWTIRFPNGTEKTVSSPETFYGPMGTYSIVSVTWKGKKVNHTTPSIFLHSNITWNPRIDCILPTSISISLSSSTSYVGFKVEINGNLTWNEVGISGSPIFLSYSVTGGYSWNEITLVNTASDGSYSAVWMPSATGNYLVRATWSGNSTYPGTTTIINLAVTPFKDQSVFSVTSNSTISGLAFNTTNWQLSFTATGPNGTKGYTKITVAKSLVANITDIRVYLDGKQIEYSITSTDDSWLLTFTYTHSTHQVVADLDINIIPEFPSLFILPLFIIATLLAVIIHRRKHTMEC